MRFLLPSRSALALLALASLALPAAAQVTRVDQLRYPALPRFDLPQPQRVVLDNGLVVLLLQDRELPLVEATVLVRAGARFDAADKVGLAQLASAVLRSGGTRKLSGDELDDWLDSRAVSLEASASDDAVRATLSSLKADFPDALRVFADVLRRPAFDPRKLEVERNRLISEVSRQNDEPLDILFREFSELVYGPESPYGRSATYATLGAIRPEDVAAWHRQGFHPDRMVIGLAGDFDPAEALRLVREAFGDWPRGPRTELPQATWREKVAPGVYFAEKPGVAQSGVMMGYLGVRKDHPDFYPLEILNEVLSGGSGRLFSNVRTRKGLAYAVSGSVGSQWIFPGTVRLFLTTKVETTAAGIEALLEEADLEARPVTDQEVEKARRSLLDSFIFRVDSPRKVLAQQLTLELYGYPLDWLSRYRGGLEAVTADQVRQAGRRHLRPKEFAILVVGPSEGRDKPLTTFGTVTPVDLRIPGTAPGAPANAQ